MQYAKYSIIVFSLYGDLLVLEQYIYIRHLKWVFNSSFCCNYDSMSVILILMRLDSEWKKKVILGFICYQTF